MTFVRSFFVGTGPAYSGPWTPMLRFLYRSDAPAQGEDGNW